MHGVCNFNFKIIIIMYTIEKFTDFTKIAREMRINRYCVCFDITADLGGFLQVTKRETRKVVMRAIQENLKVKCSVVNNTLCIYSIEIKIKP